MNIYDHTVDGNTSNTELESICSWLAHEAYEIEIHEANILHKRRVGTCHDIDIYYDFGADYYFFAVDMN